MKKKTKEAIILLLIVFGPMILAFLLLEDWNYWISQFK